jgi:hypothetical protein
MNLTYLIISLAVFLISGGFIWYGSSSRKTDTNLLYGGFAVMIAALVAAIYYAITPEARTSVPGFLQVSGQSGNYSANSNASSPTYTTVYDPNAVGSDKIPDWMLTSPTMTPAERTAAASSDQKTLINSWLNRTVGAAIPDNLKPTSDTDIRSILVRRKNGTTAEIPIMQFFRKLNDDAILAYDRAKDYTDWRLAGGQGQTTFTDNVVRYGGGIRLGLADNTAYKLTHNGAGTAALQNAPGQNGQVWIVVG